MSSNIASDSNMKLRWVKRTELRKHESSPWLLHNRDGVRLPIVYSNSLWDEQAQTCTDVIAEAKAHGKAGPANVDQECESPPIVNMSEDVMEVEVDDEDLPALQASTADNPRCSEDRSDPPNGPNDSNAKQSALQQFASALQNVQEITIQREKDQASQN